MLATGDGGLAALERCDVVVKTPGLSRYRPEVARLTGLGIPVVGGLGLWLAEADLRRVLCVTGTKGKSTTSSVTGHLLAGLGYRCMVGGNIGAPPYDPANAMATSTTGSSRCPATRPPTCRARRPWSRSPRCTRTTWTGTGEWSSTTGTSCPRAPSRAPNSPWRTATATCSGSAPACSARGSSGSAKTTSPAPDWMEPLGLPGRHNRRNALIARRCLVALGVPGAADDARLRAAAAGYQPLPSRLTPVGTVGGVTFVDDSLSTNVLPTLAALDAFPGRRIALIVGGHDRGIDYAPLAAGVAGPRRAHLRPDPPRQRPPHPRPDRGRPDRGSQSRRPASRA